MKIAGRAELGKIGKLGRVPPATRSLGRLPSDSEGPSTASSCGMGTSGQWRVASAGNALRGLGSGARGGREAVWWSSICTW